MRVPVLLFFLLLGNSLLTDGYGQVPGDSVTVNYDSIQDVRINQMQYRINARINQLGEIQTTISEQLNTIYDKQEAYRERMDLLAEQEHALKEDLSVLRQKIDTNLEASYNYRLRLQRRLWISGFIIFVLIVSIFLTLLLHANRIKRDLQQQFMKLRRRTEKAITKLSSREDKRKRVMKKEMKRRIQKSIRRVVKRKKGNNP